MKQKEKCESFNVRLFNIKFTLKIEILFMELPKCIMQYLVTAWENKQFFTFSLKRVAMSNI